MPLPEGYLPRKGDILSVCGTVKYDMEAGDDYIHVTINGTHRSDAIEVEHVTLVRRRWSKDEKVQSNDSFWPEPGIVLATAGEFVWVKDPNTGEPITYPANALKEWRDPQAPLEIDADSILREAPVAAAMEEPPEPPPNTPTVAELTIENRAPSVPAAPSGDDDIKF